MSKKVVKFKPKWFYDPIYRVNFYVAFGRDHDVFLKWVKKEHGIDLDSDDEAGGLSWTANGNQYIWVSNRRNLDHLCHESLHAAISVLCDSGVNISRAEQEPICYYHMWIFHELRSAAK